jgi:hypothetical protein
MIAMQELGSVCSKAIPPKRLHIHCSHLDFALTIPLCLSWCGLLFGDFLA